MRLIQTIDNDEFYPTPATLAKRMLAEIDWNMVQTVLEPSAGKGDILREVALATESIRHDMDIDCIEADASLRQVLRYNFSEVRLSRTVVVLMRKIALGSGSSITEILDIQQFRKSLKHS